jgi:adenosylcobinamide-phosphate synthase
VWIGKPIGFLDRRLNRPERAERDRLIRGAITVLITVAAWAGIGWALARWFAGAPWGWAAEALLVAVLLAGRSLHDHVARVGKALRADGLEGGRREIAHLVSRDPRSLDRHGVARSAIESLTENFSEAWWRRHCSICSSACRGSWPIRRSTRWTA